MTVIRPHGGRLVDRMVDGTHADQIKDEVTGSPTLTLTHKQLQDAVNIANGRYSPLEGFMSRNDFLKVLSDKTLEDGTIWTIPIVLDVDTDWASTLSIGEWTGLKDPTDQLIGAIEIADIYRYDSEKAVQSIYGTTDTDHPGVARFYARDPFFVGGSIVLFERTRHSQVDLLPKETRVLFEQRGWDTVAGFQTRNAPHRAHEYIQKSALEHVDALLIQPKMGDKKEGDYTDNAIIGAYQTLLNEYYPEDRVALSVFPSKMNYAGPREAVFDAIVRKNQGCSHFIVGRDHAGVKDYYDGYASQRIFEMIGDIGITPQFFNYSFYCERCDGMASEKICPHDEKVQTHPSGTAIRETIDAGTLPSEKLIRPEVASYIKDHEQPFVAETDGERDG